eukprot:4531281-Prymnesium_polylepis.1
MAAASPRRLPSNSTRRSEHNCVTRCRETRCAMTTAPGGSRAKLPVPAKESTSHSTARNGMPEKVCSAGWASATAASRVAAVRPVIPLLRASSSVST